MDKNTNKPIDLQDLWNRMAEEKFGNALIEKQNIMDTIKLKSSSDINLLKKRLGYKIMYSVGFMILFVISILFNLSNKDFVLLMIGTTVIYFLLTVLLYWKYRKMGNEPLNDQSILASMKENLKNIKDALNFEKIWGLFIVPLAVPVGLMIGSALDGIPISETIADPDLRMKAIVIILIATPLIYILSEKMNMSSYGGLIKDLEENIIRLETLS